jgi:hypothetical protein
VTVLVRVTVVEGTVKRSVVFVGKVLVLTKLVAGP